jgi:hypothetical protein
VRVLVATEELAPRAVEEEKGRSLPDLPWEKGRSLPDLRGGGGDAGGAPGGGAGLE